MSSDLDGGEEAEVSGGISSSFGERGDLEISDKMAAYESKGVRSGGVKGKHRFGVLVLGHKISRRFRNDISCENGSEEHWHCGNKSKCSPSETWSDSVAIEIFPEHDPSHEPDIDGSNHPKAVTRVIEEINEGETWQ